MTPRTFIASHAILLLRPYNALCGACAIACTPILRFLSLAAGYLHHLHRPQLREDLLSMPIRPSRRTFLKLTAAATSVAAADFAHAIPANRSPVLVADTGGLLASQPVQWALAELHRACAEKGIAVSPSAGKLAIVVALSSSPLAAGFIRTP